MYLVLCWIYHDLTDYPNLKMLGNCKDIGVKTLIRVPCNTRGARTRSLSLQFKWDKLIIRLPFCNKTVIRCRLNGTNICLCQVGHCGNDAEHATLHLLYAGSSDNSVVTGARSNNQGTKLPPHSHGLLSVRPAVHILYDSVHFVQ